MEDGKTVLKKIKLLGKRMKYMDKILVTRSSMPSFEEYCNEIKGLWDSHWLTNMGVKHNELQKELEEYLDVPHVTLYTNGHLALENAIAALNLPDGGEVIKHLLPLHLQHMQSSEIN